MKRLFSPGTLVGIISGFGLFCYAIYRSTENYIMFFSVNSLIMVAGGTLAATLISYRARYVFRTLQGLITILFPVHISPKSLTKEMYALLRWSAETHSAGLSGLQDMAEKSGIKDHFVKFGAGLISKGYKGERLRDLMVGNIDSSFERNMIQASILQTMGAIAPAFGMIGTLVGLIIMLEQMGGDVSKIGPGLAIALLTTLYGVLLSQLLFKPAAEKLQQGFEMTRYRNELIMEGFMMLTEGKLPLEIQDKLNSLLAPATQLDMGQGA
ncbi:MAG: chemotaxis protein MotA [Candidatus Marinamargulisbacteria bacterium]|jgi:chemotaxis protein MotA